MKKSYKRLRLLEMARDGNPPHPHYYKPQIEWGMRNGFIHANGTVAGHYALTEAGQVELDRYKPKYQTNHFGLSS